MTTITDRARPSSLVGQSGRKGPRMYARILGIPLPDPGTGLIGLFQVGAMR